MSGARRPPYPRINTDPRSKNTASARTDAAHSPSNIRYPVSASSASRGMSHRKRPTETRSRGNSPPTVDKRTRIDNPTPLRQDNGPTDKRRTDPNARGAIPSDGRRTSVPHTASHAQSTDVNSGGSTPTHGAPPVPSMLPKPTSDLVAPKTITLASLRSIKQKKEAISKAAMLQGESAKVGAPQNEKLNDELSSRLKALEDLPSQMNGLKLQLDKVSGHSKALETFIHRLVELESNKDISGTVEQLEEAIKRLEANQAESAHLMAKVNDLEQSRSGMRQDIENAMKTLSEFKKQQEKLNISSRVGQVAQEIADFRTEQAKLDIPSRLQKLYGYVGLRNEDLDDFEHESVVQRIDKHEARVEKLESLRADIPTTLVEAVGTIQAEQSASSQKVAEVTATLLRVEKVQQEHAKILEKQEKLTPLVGQVQSLQSDQAELCREQRDISTTQTTMESRSKAREDKDATAPPQIDTTHSAKMDEFQDTVQSIQDRTTHVEQQLSDIRVRFPTLPVEQINIVEAMVPRLARLEQQAKENDDRASKLPTEHVNGSVEGQLRTQIQFSTDLKQVKRNVKELFNEVHEVRDSIGDLLNNVLADAGIFSSVSKLPKLEEDVQALQQQLLPVSSRPDIKPLEDAMKHLGAKFAHLQTAHINEAALRQQEMLDVRNQLAANPSTAYVDAALDALRAALRGLQDQYNNITTDDLHAKMTQWLIQNYPGGSTQALQQLMALEHDVRDLQITSRDTAWLQSKIHDIKSLLEMGPQISALVQKAEADGVDTQSLATAVRDIQQTLREAKPNSNSLVRHGDVLHIREDIEKQVKAHCTSISNKDRTDVATSVTVLNDRVQILENASTVLPARLQEQLDKLMADVKGLQEISLFYPDLMRSIGGMQTIISEIRRNWPRNAEPFECVFSVDFRNPKQPAMQQAQVNGGSANKGKTRQV